jgi:hypothetical protein
MAVLNRKLFNRGGPVSSRGVGITSGLVPRYSHGGPVSEHDIYRAGAKNPNLDQIARINVVDNAKNSLNKFITNKVVNDMIENMPDPESNLQKTYLEYLDMIQGIKGKREPVSNFELLAPSALTFFGNLMSGRSLQSGLGGALDITGESLKAATPQLESALQSKRALKESRMDAEDKAKMEALSMAYDDLAAEKTAASKTTYTQNKYEVKMKNSEDGSTTVATEFFNKNDPSGTYYTIDGNVVSANDFDIIGTLGQAKDTAPKQNYQYQDYKIILDDDSSIVLTKVEDKTGTNAPKWIDANGNDFDSSKIKIIEGTLGAAKDEPTPKKRTPTTDTYYAPNPKWKEGDDITEKYLQIAAKIDEDNNIMLKDPETNQYITEETFTEKYKVSAVSDQPLDWKPKIEADVDITGDTADIIAQKKVFTDRFKVLYPESGFDLNEAELDYLLAAFPPGSDFIKTLQTGQVNELDGELFNIFKNKNKINEANLAESKSNTHADGTVKDAVDLYYNLDNRSPDYQTRKAFYVQKYNAIPMMSAADIKSVTEAVQNLKDLNVIFDNVDEAIPILGKPAAIIAQTFGVNLGLVEFMTAKKGLEATAIEQLVSGVPSNFDAQRIIATLPNESLAPGTNKIRIKRLNSIFSDLILNKIKHNVQLGKRVPADLVLLARELGNVKEVDAILRGGVNEEKVKYLDNISAGVEGFTKQGYIEKFGDSFSRSISLIEATDESLNEPLSENEKKELENFKEKYKQQK